MTIASAVWPLVAAALESSNTLVAVFDVAEDEESPPIISEVSDRFVQFCGRAREAMLGETIATIAAPDAPMEGIEAALRGYRAYRGDLPCVSADGAAKFLGLHLMPVNGEGVNSRHYVLIGRDITAQRRESAQSKQVQSLLLKSFMMTGQAMAIVAGDERVVMANPRLESMLGVGVGSINGWRVMQIVLPPYRQLVSDARAAATGTCQVDVELDAPSSAPVAVSLRFAPMGGEELRGFTMVSALPYRRGVTLPVQLRMAGKIRFVSLESIRELVGDKWEEGAARILDVAEAMIRKRLQPGDVIARTTDRGFTICFAGGSEEEASELAASIAREIRHFLLTRGTHESLLGITAVTSKVATNAQGEPDMAQVSRHMAAVETLVKERARPAPDFVPVVSAGDGVVVASMLCTGGPESEGGARQAFPESDIDQELAALSAAAGLEVFNSLLVDVGFSTLSEAASAARYLAACEALPREVCERLYFVLSPLPRRAAQTELQTVMRRFGLFCAGFGLRIENLRQPEIDMSVCKPAMMVIDMRRWEGGESVPADRLRLITGLARPFRVRVLGVNVRDGGIAGRLHSSGVDWVTLAGGG